MNEFLLCVVIVIAKAVEILTYTVRTVLCTKNQKFAVTVLGALNNTIGIILLITVLSGINESLDRAFAFAIGETLGTYLGMILDKKLAFGKAVFTIVVSKSISDKVISNLNRNNFKTTYMYGKGYKDDRVIIKIFADRKQKDEVIKIINEENAKAVIFENNILNLKTTNQA